MHYKLSKNEWLAIGSKSGWLKSAKKYESLSKCRQNCPDLDVDLRQECKDECEREYGDTAKKKTAAEIKAFEKTAAKAEFAMKVDMPELRAEFLGFDVDSNGNKIARFKKYSGETVRIQTNGNLPKSHRMTNQSLDAKAIEQEVLSSSYASKFALKPRSSRPGTKAKMSATFIVAEAIFNAENAVRRGDNENARRWIKAAQDAMDETVVSTGMRSKLEQLVKRYKMSRPGVKAKA